MMRRNRARRWAFGLASVLACAVPACTKGSAPGVTVTWKTSWEGGSATSCAALNGSAVRLSLQGPDDPPQVQVAPCEAGTDSILELDDGRYSLDVELLNAAKGIVARAATKTFNIEDGHATVNAALVAKRHSLALDWKIAGQASRERTCDAARAKSVQLDVARAGTSFLSSTFECAKRAAISDALPVGAYDVTATLLSDDRVSLSKATFPIEIAGEAPTDAGAILFRVLEIEMCWGPPKPREWCEKLGATNVVVSTMRDGGATTTLRFACLEGCVSSPALTKGSYTLQGQLQDPTGRTIASSTATALLESDSASVAFSFSP